MNNNQMTNLTNLGFYRKTSAQKVAESKGLIDITTVETPRKSTALFLDFANSQTLDPRITFTRSSIATRVNKRGYVETMISGEPRFEYDPITLACRGLFIEEGRTNLFLQSSDLTNAWTVNTATVAANVTTSPSGLVDADSFTVTTNGGRFGQNVAITAGSAGAPTPVSMSIFVKSLTSTFLRMDFHGRTSIWFNIVTGTVTYENTGGDDAVTSYAPSSAYVEDYGNGWFRCSATVNTATTTLLGMYFYPTNASGSSSSVGSSFYVWGVQCEVGSYKTSYIPTTTVTVPRANDKATMTGSNLSSWFSYSKGTFLVEYKPNDNYNAAVLAINDGTTANRISLRKDNSGALWTVNNSLLAFVNFGGNSVRGLTYKQAFRFSPLLFDCYLNGVYGNAYTNLPLPQVNRFDIGNFNDASFLNGTIKYIVYYADVLSISKLKYMTT